MSKKKVFCFGSGFRKFEPVRSITVFPSQAPKEIAPEIDPVEQFRFEKMEISDSNASYRVRSDVSMQSFFGLLYWHLLGKYTLQRTRYCLF